MTTKKRKPKKRIRCPYRKGDHVIHNTLGVFDVAATKKVGEKRWQLALVDDNGYAVIVPADHNIRKL